MTEINLCFPLLAFAIGDALMHLGTHGNPCPRFTVHPDYSPTDYFLDLYRHNVTIIRSPPRFVVLLQDHIPHYLFYL